MEHIPTLFVGTFTTLLAIINPLEALPVFLKLLEGKSEEEHGQVARRSCFYATLLLFFFLLFGTAMLKIFEVPLSMVRIVGGIVLMRIGFGLFMPSSSGEVLPAGADSTRQKGDVAFVPLAMPIMFGPGAIATIIGMSSLVRHPLSQYRLHGRDFRYHRGDDVLHLSHTDLCQKDSTPHRAAGGRCDNTHCRFFRIRHGDGADLPRCS